jgi:hypothetical protein
MPISFSWTVGITSPTPDVTSTTSVDTAMRDFALDANGDICLDSNGDIVVVSGTAAIVSELKSRLQTFAGECFLDTTLGVPWLEKILGHKPTVGELDAIFREVILGTPGMTSLTKLIVSQASRTLTVAFGATAATGATLELALGINLGGN